LFSGLLKTMRPRQWPKNGFVFAALFFDRQVLDINSILQAILAFILLCLVSSAVYIMNDLADIESDREHPTKRDRPLPSGQLSPNAARIALVILVVVGMSASFTLSFVFGLILLGYFLLQVAYTWQLKHMVLLDVSAVATGFILRVAAGVAIVEVERFSPWLYVCTGFLALFLALGKRRHELVLLGDGAGNHRAILQEYNLDLIDRLMGIVATSCLVSYSLYTFQSEGLPPNHFMMLTIPFALYTLFRLLYLIHVRQEGGAPEEILLRDRPLQITLFFWAVVIFLALYVFS
jgi:4-hydroxybenzoate polyprenyltransferase